MVQQSVLGRVALRLQSTEKSLLRTQNLNSRCRVLGEVGQASGVRDQTSTNNLSDQGSQVGSNDAHLGNQVGVEGLAVLGKAHNAFGKGDHIFHVSLGDLLAHAVLGGIDNASSNTLIVFHKGSQVVKTVLRKGSLVLHKESDLSIALVV